MKPQKISTGKPYLKTAYILALPCLILLTGILAMFLGMGNFFSEEADKNIIETLSTLIGSIYLSFLLGRFRRKDWKNGYTKKERAFYFGAGCGLAAARYLSRLIWMLLEYRGYSHAAYIGAILTDLSALLALWHLMPASEKEAAEND